MDIEVSAFFQSLDMNPKCFQITDILDWYGLILLDILCRKEENHEELDATELSYIVRTMSKIFKNILELSDLPLPDVYTFCANEFELVHHKEESTYDMVDRIYIYSRAVAAEVYHEGLEDFLTEIIYTMFENSCYVYCLFYNYAKVSDKIYSI